MFDIYGCYFDYDGFESVDYDLIFGNIDTSRITMLESVRNVNTIRSRKNHTNYITRVSYDDQPIQIEAEIVRSDGDVISDADLPLIEKALFSRSSYGKLRPREFHENQPVYINCIFVNPEKIEVVGGIAGFKFTIVTDSVMAWEEPQTQEINVGSLDNGAFTVNVVSDMDEYIYPDVVITTGDTGGDVVIYNSTDDATRFTSFVGLPASTAIRMNGDINYLSNEFYQFFNDRNFIRLLDGENEFFVDGDISTISITFSNRRYI